MILFLTFVLSLTPPFGVEVQEAYAHENVEVLRSMLETTESHRESMLIRYRLYPLTEDGSLVNDLPKVLQEDSARELALLSGLWSYRAGEASLLRAVSYGRRSAKLLEQAKEIDPDDPYVLLVEGQSLLFRPRIAGRDPSAAVDRFETLASKVQDSSNHGISRMEAQVWKWLALREAGRTDVASQLHKRLLGRAPPPLYHQFLRDPPDV